MAILIKVCDLCAVLALVTMVCCHMIIGVTGFSVPLDLDFAKLGRKFDGVGALSGGGGTSRLLYDYSEPQRTEILDALFDKNDGGALQIFKTEIGGDTQSTEATEPSHMHSRDDLNFSRGYEWWLMKEAKKRNPDVKLYSLSWGTPGWVGNGNFFSDDNILYHINWLKGAKSEHNLTLDYMGIWNEHSASLDWIIKLRNALDSEGFSSVKIVATDQGGWPICDPMLQNSTLRDAVAIIGSHYPVQGPNAPSTGASCLELNEKYSKPLWTSEGWNLGHVNDYDGAMNLASTINRNYVLQNQTAMVVWNLIYSWYSILPFAHPTTGSVGGMGHGLMSATEPWSGHYRLQPPLYMVMHTSQFTEPGCLYIENSAVAMGGFLDALNASSIVGFVCSTWFTLVIETSGLHQPSTQQPVVFQLSNVPKSLTVSTLQVFRSCNDAMFQTLSPLKVSAGAFAMKLNASCVYTVTSATDRGQTVPTHDIPQSKSFPADYSDNFEAYADQQTVKYLTDQAGSFNAAPAKSGGMLLKQVVTQPPINGAWWGNSEPYSIMGNSQNWTDITVTVTVMVDPSENTQDASADSIVAMKANVGCLDILGAYNNKCDDGNPVFTYGCHDSTNQAWQYPAVGKTGNIQSLEHCLTATPALNNASEFEPLTLTMEECSNSSSWQTWHMTWPSIQLVVPQALSLSSSSSRCLDLGPAPTRYPTNPLAVASLCSTTATSQQWENGTARQGSQPAPQFVKVCSRISTFKPNGEPAQGYCLIVDGKGHWFLTQGGTGPDANHRDRPNVLATGAVPAGVNILTSFHELKLSVKGSSITGSVDGAVVGSVTDSTFTHGMVAIGCGWHVASFDNFTVSATPTITML